MATKGLLVYELRNSQIRAAAGERMVLIEGEIFARGPIANVRPRKALGIGLTHTLAVAMVYGAALGGWVYLVVWGALRAFGAGHDAREASAWPPVWSRRSSSRCSLSGSSLPPGDGTA